MIVLRAQESPLNLILATYAKNSFTHELAQQLVTPSGLFANATLVVKDNPPGVIEEVASGRADYGVIPWWNLYADTSGVPLSYRLLVDNHPFVHRVVRKRIKLSLSTTGTSFEEINTVYAMRVLAPQCQQFFEESLAGVEVIHDGIDNTPKAMAKALSHGRGAAAVGPAGAAREAGLTIIRDGVENPDNTTSFFIVSKLQPLPGGRRLLLVEVSDKVDEAAAIGDVLSPAFRRSDYLAYDYRLEDRAYSRERNHLFIVSVSPPNNPPLPLASEYLVCVTDIGAALDASERIY